VHRTQVRLLFQHTAARVSDDVLDPSNHVVQTAIKRTLQLAHTIKAAASVASVRD